MGHKGAGDVLVAGGVAAGAEAGQAHDDPGRAETALARPRRGEGVGPGVAQGGIEPFERGDLAAQHTSGRSDTGHPRGPVHPHGAAPALALGAAPVLGRAATEVLSQDLKQ